MAIRANRCSYFGPRYVTNSWGKRRSGTEASSTSMQTGGAPTPTFPAAGNGYGSGTETRSKTAAGGAIICPPALYRKEGLTAPGPYYSMVGLPPRL